MFIPIREGSPELESHFQEPRSGKQSTMGSIFRLKGLAWCSGKGR